MYFWVSQREVSPDMLGSRPCWGKRSPTWKSINREAPSLIWTHNNHKQVPSKEEKDKFIGKKKNKLQKLSYILGILSLFDIVLSDESILMKLFGFSWERVFKDEIFVSLFCFSFIYFSDPISLDYRSNIFELKWKL